MNKLLFLLIIILCLSVSIHSSKTNYVTHEGYSAFTSGKFNKTSVNTNGMIYLSNEYDIKEISDYEIIWDINFDSQNNLYLFTGFDGIVKNITNDKEFQTELLSAVISYGDDNGDIYFGGFVGGHIYKISNDTMIKFTSLNDSYVWTIKEYDNNHIIVGTGSKGNIYKINKISGESELLVSTVFNNITTVAKHTDNSILFGSSESAAIYKYSDGKITILVNFDGDEVVDIIPLNNENILIGINKGKHIFLIAESMPMFDDRFQRNSSQGSGMRLDNMIENNSFIDSQNENIDSSIQEEYNEGDSKQQAQQNVETQSMGRKVAQTTRSGDFQGTIYMFNKSGNISEIYSTSNGYINSFEYITPNNVLVAAGNLKKIINIDLDTLIAADFISSESRDFVKIRKLKSKNKIYAITKKPVSLYTIQNNMASNGEFISKVIDFGYSAKVGNVLSIPEISAQNVSLQYRNGNIDQPNDYWSEWSDNVFELNYSRYFQYKIIFDKDKFVDISPEIRKIVIPYIKINRAPVIKNLSIDKNNQIESRGGQAGNQKRSASANSSSKQKDYNITIFWEAFDPDGDILAYNIYYKNLENDLWVKINDSWIKDNNYLLDTRYFQDGYYVFKLEATDKYSNIDDNKYITSAKSDIFLIDNTPPFIKIENFVVSNNSLYLYANISDDYSIINEQYYKLNREEWCFIMPEDLINDSKQERIKIVIENLNSGVNTISIKFSDFAGNSGYWTKDFVVE